MSKNEQECQIAAFLKIPLSQNVWERKDSACFHIIFTILPRKQGMRARLLCFSTLSSKTLTFSKKCAILAENRRGQKTTAAPAAA